VTQKASLSYAEVHQMMTPEERLDRLERIAKQLVRAGLRARRQARQQDDKITIMVDAQIKNEERFQELVESQRALIEIAKNSRNGKSR
jgi:hypothetical protein